MYLFFIILFILQFYYFFIDFFLFGLFAHYGYSLGLSIVLIGILLIHGLIFYTILQLYKGMSNREPWTRKFTMFYLVWASLWAIWGLAVGNNSIVHLSLLIIYILMIFYLNTPLAQLYFERIYRYGKYILYTKLVTLKSGLKLPIYFFSWKTPKSGHPTSLPDGYTVKENQKSHMPYLKKIDTRVNPKKQESTDEETLEQESISDIIFVVNNGSDKNHTEPWVVKSHTKIYDHVKTKQKAIQIARQVARTLHARVLVQNTNGKFSYGFTPRPRKES